MDASDFNNDDDGAEALSQPALDFGDSAFEHDGEFDLHRVHAFGNESMMQIDDPLSSPIYAAAWPSQSSSQDSAPTSMSAPETAPDATLAAEAAPETEVARAPEAAPEAEAVYDASLEVALESAPDAAPEAAIEAAPEAESRSGSGSGSGFDSGSASDSEIEDGLESGVRAGSGATGAAAAADAVVASDDMQPLGVAPVPASAAMDVDVDVAAPAIAAVAQPRVALTPAEHTAAKSKANRALRTARQKFNNQVAMTQTQTIDPMTGVMSILANHGDLVRNKHRRQGVADKQTENGDASRYQDAHRAEFERAYNAYLSTPPSRPLAEINVECAAKTDESDADYHQHAYEMFIAREHLGFRMTGKVTNADGVDVAPKDFWKVILEKNMLDNGSARPRTHAPGCLVYSMVNHRPVEVRHGPEKRLLFSFKHKLLMPIPADYFAQYARHPPLLWLPCSVHDRRVGSTRVDARATAHREPTSVARYMGDVHVTLKMKQLDDAVTLRADRYKQALKHATRVSNKRAAVGDRAPIAPEAPNADAVAKLLDAQMEERLALIKRRHELENRVVEWRATLQRVHGMGLGTHSHTPTPRVWMKLSGSTNERPVRVQINASDVALRIIVDATVGLSPVEMQVMGRLVRASTSLPADYASDVVAARLDACRWAAFAVMRAGIDADVRPNASPAPFVEEPIFIVLVARALGHMLLGEAMRDGAQAAVVEIDARVDAAHLFARIDASLADVRRWPAAALVSPSTLANARAALCALVRVIIVPAHAPIASIDDHRTRGLTDATHLRVSLDDVYAYVRRVPLVYGVTYVHTAPALADEPAHEVAPPASAPAPEPAPAPAPALESARESTQARVRAAFIDVTELDDADAHMNDA